MMIVTQIEGRSTILFHAAFQDENSSRNMGDKVQRSCPLVAKVHPSFPYSKPVPLLLHCLGLSVLCWGTRGSPVQAEHPDTGVPYWMGHEE